MFDNNRLRKILSQSEYEELDNVANNLENFDNLENTDKFVELMDLVTIRYIEKHPTVESIKADINYNLSLVTKEDFENYLKKANTLYNELRTEDINKAAGLLSAVEAMPYDKALDIVKNNDDWHFEPNNFTCIIFLNMYLGIELDALAKLKEKEDDTEPKAYINSLIITEEVIEKAKEFYPEFYKEDEDVKELVRVQSPIRANMTYPDKNKEMLWIFGQTFENRLKDCVSVDNKPIYLDAMQRKLVTTLYNIRYNPEPGMENHIVTLNYIIKYFYGKNGKDENPTNEERENFLAMLQYFHTTPIVTPITDENGDPKLLHTYIVDLDYIEGIANGTRCAELFHIKEVIDLETIGSFPYYEAGLPPRMAHSLENIRIQQAVFDTRFSLENNKQIDFEKLCKSLKIRQNSKRRNEVIGKIQKMIRYYGMGEYVYPIEDNNGKVGRNKIVLLEIR